MQKFKKISPEREKELKELFSLRWDRNVENCQAEFQSKETYVSYCLAKEKGVTNV
jgi:hypothetical protein